MLVVPDILFAHRPECCTCWAASAGRAAAQRWRSDGTFLSRTFYTHTGAHYPSFTMRQHVGRLSGPVSPPVGRWALEANKSPRARRRAAPLVCQADRDEAAAAAAAAAAAVGEVLRELKAVRQEMQAGFQKLSTQQVGKEGAGGAALPWARWCCPPAARRLPPAAQHARAQTDERAPHCTVTQGHLFGSIVAITGPDHRDNELSFTTLEQLLAACGLSSALDAVLNALANPVRPPAAKCGLGDGATSAAVCTSAATASTLHPRALRAHMCRTSCTSSAAS